MKNVFGDWISIRRRIARSLSIDLFLDLDGTLVPIAPTPREVTLPDSVRRVLKSLQETGKCRIGIISGRSIQEVRAIVRLAALYYAGNHGLQIAGPGIDFTYPLTEDQIRSLDAVANSLRKSLCSFRELQVEQKGLSISVHFRRAPYSMVPWVRSVVEETVRKTRDLELSYGKMVAEIRPAVKWNKGAAVNKIRGLFRVKGFPIYIGDDETDEDVFVSLKEGVTAVVDKEGGEGSAARYCLEDADQVYKFLIRLLAVIRRR